VVSLLFLNIPGKLSLGGCIHLPKSLDSPRQFLYSFPHNSKLALQSSNNFAKGRHMSEMNLLRHITPTEQGLYLLLPFEMPANIAWLNLHYSYQTHTSEPVTTTEWQFARTRRLNIVDIG